jgi:hypothetical protein
MRSFKIVSAALVIWCALGIQAHAADQVRWEKKTLTDKYYCDGVNVGDFNRDGHTDVVAGPFWYEGPSLERAHEFYPAISLPPEESPSNSMFCYVWDFSGDGWEDILVLGRVHLHEAYWYLNPRTQSEQWKKHFVFERIPGESPPFVDVDVEATAGRSSSATGRSAGAS